MAVSLISIITGDIVNSQQVDAQRWQEALAQVLGRRGQRPGDWDIFRGDSFQLRGSMGAALRTALEIKAAIKAVDSELDVRMALGIGGQDEPQPRITDSTGEAFTHSGHCFDELKKRRLALRTPWSAFDEEWDLLLMLASLTMDQWKPITALIFLEALLHPELTQNELADQLGRNQSTISESLSRAGYPEITALLAKFERQITTLSNPT